MIAKKPENNKKEKMEKVDLSVLVTAMKGGETRIERLIMIATDDVTPAAVGAAMVEELKGLQTLLQALERAVENIG